MSRLELLTEPGSSRREFLQLLGLGMLATACRPPREKILPYARQPPELKPGKPLPYASSLVEDGYAFGVVVESHLGRPTRIDGNPDHPASLGATNPWHQAAILDLYAPNRLRTATLDGQPTSWDRFARTFGSLPPDGQKGEGLHFVLLPTSSPLRIALIERVRKRLPGATFHFHRPFYNPQVVEASRRLYGRPLLILPRLDQTRVVAFFDDDPFSRGPMSVRLSRDFSNARRIRAGGPPPNRLYVVEGDLSLAGAMADHRLRVRPSHVPALLAALVREVASLLPEAVAAGGLPPPTPAEGPAQPHKAWIHSLAVDLVRSRGAAGVTVGARQPLEAHLLCQVLNGWLQAPLSTWESVIYEEGTGSHGLDGLAAALDTGAVSTLVWLEGDPLADTSDELSLSEKVARVPQSIAVGLTSNATTRSARWCLPSLHPLEQWGDARAFDGTISWIQPLILPLFDGHGPTEVLAVFAGEVQPDAHRLLRELHGDTLDDTALASGFQAGSAAPQVRLEPAAAGVAAAALGNLKPPAGGLEVSLLPDLRLGAGGADGNDWLVELPHPITSVCWDNPAHVSPGTLKEQGWSRGDIIEIVSGERRLALPVIDVPGVADGAVFVSLGWGRSPRGVHDEPTGADGFRLLGRDGAWILPGVEARPMTRRKALGEEERARTILPLVQHHMDMEGRPILREQSLASLLEGKEHRAGAEAAPSLYPSAFSPKGHQWGMSIDLNVCTGCSACVVACQSENNIPTVGRIGVLKGRHMHWLRIDRYRLGTDEDDVRLLPQPMLCQHCEKAPCEYVCPVNATVHSPDGLNEMVYNRCIGTRFCSNNCPYKVRRFNWLEYNGDLSSTEQMQKNPNVTVRARGVMEKCTYCVQRIRLTEIDKRIEGRAIQDGDVRTACQAACPTEAIVFGLVSDPQSAVSRLHAEPHSYLLLQEELGTLPRTRYLAHLRNENGGES